MRALVSCQLFITLLFVVTPGVLAQEAVPRGRQVFETAKCAVCHSIAGKGNPKGSLDDVASRLSAEDIREWIVNAPVMAAKVNATRKPAMRSFMQLSAEDLDALVAYLATLRK